jgi:hypothetical protein
MSADQIVATTYAVAHGLNELKHDRELISQATYQAVNASLRMAQDILDLIDRTEGLTHERRAAERAAVRARIDQANEASLCGTDELKWADVGRLALRPRLLGRLAQALWAEFGHSWHRLTGSYDTAVFSGSRLTPSQRQGSWQGSATGPASPALWPGR